jgi:hypothetical protein
MRTAGRDAEVASDSETEKKFVARRFTRVEVLRILQILGAKSAPHRNDSAAVAGTCRSLSNRQGHVSGMYKASALSANGELVDPSLCRLPDLQGQDRGACSHDRSRTKSPRRLRR